MSMRTPMTLALLLHLNTSTFKMSIRCVTLQQPNLPPVTTFRQCIQSLWCLQDFASAGANMYTFHLEAVVEDAVNAKHPDQQMVKVLKQVKEAGMHTGVALRPKTPVETLYPYMEDKLVDQVPNCVHL